MRGLIWRESTVIVRTLPYWLAMGAHGLLLAAFVLVWAEGVPAMDGTFLEQIAVVQAAVLAIVLPWTAARCGCLPPAELAGIAAVLAVAPSRLLQARCVALFITLGAIAASGLPLVLIAQQMSAVAPAQIIDLWPSLLTSIGVVVVVTTGCQMMARSRLFAWLAATAVVLVALRFAHDGRAPAILVLGLVIVGAIAMVRGADSVLMYRPGGPEGPPLRTEEEDLLRS